MALHDSADERLIAAKTPSTPDDPSRGALVGIDLVLERAKVSLRDVGQVVHATTHGANVIIEGAGACTALLITQGFGDILVLQRQLRHSPYDLMLDRHAPLVPRERVFEVPERLAFDGSVHRPLDEEKVRSIVCRLGEMGVQSVAICLLHSYVNPQHERRVAAILREIAPHLVVSLSCDVAPLIREYDRASTVVADAYIRPAFSDYLSRLQAGLAERGFEGSLLLMQANGGVAGLEVTMEAPIRALESGPAGAVAMAGGFTRDLEIQDALAFDMGGTTAKAGLLRDGHSGIVSQFEVDKTLLRPGTGLPICVPSVDIIEIGAGGGSIARVNLGVIEVGPQSAGAEPGPACYGHGGSRPTVTDANVVLGYVNPAFFNGGSLELHPALARDAISEDIARRLDLPLEAAAWGIHDAVTANMMHAIRAVSTDRGTDPRTLTLLASGGAAPLHASRIARGLGMPRVLVPAFAGVMSAIGLLHADPRFDVAASLIATLSDDMANELDERFAQLERQALQRLASTGFENACGIERRLDLRYRGQGHSTTVVLPAATSDSNTASAARMRFEARYKELYGHAPSGASDVEVITLHVAARATSPVVRLPRLANGGGGPYAERTAYTPEAGGYEKVPVYRRDALPAETVVEGPAIVEDAATTVIALEDDRLEVDENGHLVIDVRSGQGRSHHDRERT